MAKSYTIHEMESAVSLAELDGVRHTARKLGIPETTLRRWKGKPEPAPPVPAPGAQVPTHDYVIGQLRRENYLLRELLGHYMSKERPTHVLTKV